MHVVFSHFFMCVPLLFRLKLSFGILSVVAFPAYFHLSFTIDYYKSVHAVPLWSLYTDIHVAELFALIYLSSLYLLHMP